MSTKRDEDEQPNLLKRRKREILEHHDNNSTSMIVDQEGGSRLRAKFAEARMRKKQEQKRKAQMMIPKAVAALSPRAKENEFEIKEGNTARKLAILENDIKRLKGEDMEKDWHSDSSIELDKRAKLSEWLSVQVGLIEVRLNSEQVKEFEQYKEEWETSLKSLPASETLAAETSPQNPEDIKPDIKPIKEKERLKFKRPISSPNASPSVEVCLTSAQRKENEVTEETKKLVEAVEAIEREANEISCSEDTGRVSFATPILDMSPTSEQLVDIQGQSKRSSTLFETPAPPSPLAERVAAVPPPSPLEPERVAAVPPPQDSVMRIPHTKRVPVRNIKSEIDALVENNASLSTEEINSIRLRIASTTNPLSQSEVDNVLSRLDSEDKKIVHLISTLSNKRLTIERARDQLLALQRSRQSKSSDSVNLSTETLKPEVPSPGLVGWVSGWFKK